MINDVAGSYDSTWVHCRGLTLGEVLTGVQQDHPPLLAILDGGDRGFERLAQALDDTFLGRRQIPGVREQHGHPLVAGQLGKPLEQSALADSARSIHPEQCRLPRIQHVLKEGDFSIPADEPAAEVLAEAFA
jgi:hypothetical protein